MKKFLSSLPIIILFLSLLIPAALFGQWWLFIVFLVFGICFGLIEFISDKLSGMTVSQHFWALKKSNKKGALIITIFMVLAWAMLIFHFWSHV